ncbi:hypothetical protein BGW39_007879, partial [Mortierella sp. 14UC]
MASTLNSINTEHVVSSTAVKDPASRGRPLPLPVKYCLDVFRQNVDRPVTLVALPELRSRMETTLQFSLCLGLLNKDDGQVNQEQDPLQGISCDAVARLEWIKAMRQDPMEQDRLRWLATRMVEEFAKDPSKESTEISEMVLLGPVLDNENFRKLLSCIVTKFDKADILDVDLLQGLVQLVQSAPPKSLLPDDLIKILSILRVRLQGTYPYSSLLPLHLSQAVSKILDFMTDHKIEGLNRVLEREPLSEVLSGLQKNANPFIMYQVCYAFQALQYVPDDEPVLQAVLRHSMGVVDGLVKVSAVFKLDVGAVLEGLENIQEALGDTVGAAFAIYKGATSLLETGRGVFDSFEEEYGSGQKQAWYVAIRAANALAQAGQMKDLNRLIYEAPCHRDPLFQLGICQLLGEIAFDDIWETTVHQQAIDLLEELYRNDAEWGQDEGVSIWLIKIFRHLRNASDEAVSESARTVLKDLQRQNRYFSSDLCPLRNCLPPPSSSPLLTRVQNIPSIEYDLHKLRLQRLEEHRSGIYIPPQARSNLQATEDTLFPLMEKALEFLAGHRQVLLVLGDSGAGKSTFNLELEHTLWKNYKKHGPVPLYISLPTIDNPAQDLIEKQLQFYNFSEDQIQEMKLHREFFLICDGYDESQLKINLHSTNQFNQPGHWKVKVVVSCRSQYLGQDYRSRFQPRPTGPYMRSTADLFQEAVVAAFSRDQVQQYVEAYVKELPDVDALQKRPSWTAE